MERLQYVKPSKEHEQQAIEFINEFKQYNSPIEGVNSLHRYLNNYDEWLEKIENERTNEVTDKTVPTETYFIIRENDNKIVGMSTMRFSLNRRYQNFGGNIGSSTRPTERKKGYSKIGLYLGLLIFNDNGVEKIMIDCDKNNIGSARTIQALGGKLVKETYIEDLECIKQDYEIDVKESIEKYAPLFEEHIIHNQTSEIRKR